MRQRPRWLLAAAFVAANAVIVPVLGSSSGTWQVGDVIVGIGREEIRSGEYLVFTESGDLKETLVDPFAGRTGTSAGCAIAPPSAGEALFATTFVNRDVTRFAALPPHAATVLETPRRVSIDGVDHPVEAVESVVFDTNGNYYLGGLPPSRRSADDPIPPYAFIFKYSASHQLLATYAVPNGNRGADWLDLGSDNRTLYYTSEGATIHVVTPDLEMEDPAAPRVHVFGRSGDSRYRELVVRERGTTTPIGGTLYALRLLPPIPGDPNLQPGGFIAAHSSGPLRLLPTGEVALRYTRPASIGPGSFFALNLTPDGQSFWTATFQTDSYDRLAARAGRLLRIHIASGQVTAVIDTGAPSVWGLCVKREYTAAANLCHERGSQGSYQPVPCRLPEYCVDGIDNDGDGLGDAADPDCGPWRTAPNRPPNCSAAGPSQSLWAPNQQFAPVRITGVTDPDGDAVAVTITGIQQDEPVGTSSGRFEADGRIDGAVAWIRAERGGSKPAGTGDGRVYEIHYEAHDLRSGTCSGSVLVGIPHDLGSMRMPTDNGLRWNSITGAPVR